MTIEDFVAPIILSSARHAFALALRALRTARVWDQVTERGIQVAVYQALEASGLRLWMEAGVFQHGGLCDLYLEPPDPANTNKIAIEIKWKKAQPLPWIWDAVRLRDFVLAAARSRKAFLLAAYNGNEHVGALGNLQHKRIAVNNAIAPHQFTVHSRIPETRIIPASPAAIAGAPADLRFVVELWQLKLDLSSELEWPYGEFIYNDLYV